MRIKILHVLRFTAVCGEIVMVVTGCGKKNDRIAQAEKKDQAKGIAGPGLPSTYGGEIHTPTLDRARKAGIFYNRFHSMAMCSPASKKLPRTVIRSAKLGS